jgi:hypothetical protein
MAKNTKYVSSTTEFIQSLLKNNPQMIQKQAELRRAWWDKNFTEVAHEEKLLQTDLMTPDYPYFNYANAKNKN